MPTGNATRSLKKTNSQPKTKKSAIKKPTPKRDVILAPDLFEAVLESVQQAKDGKTVSHQEVKRRSGL